MLRVVDAADRGDEHLTAEQIGGRVTALEPSVHRATVYRTLTSLSELGVLSHVHLGGSATVYHLADATPADEHTGHEHAHQAHHGHAHVQCHDCGRVFDVPPEMFAGLAQRLDEDLGFALDTGHAALLGLCRDCR